MEKLPLIRRKKRQLQRRPFKRRSIVKRSATRRVEEMRCAGRLRGGDDAGLPAQGWRKLEARTPRYRSTDAKDLSSEAKTLLEIIDHGIQRRKEECANALCRGAPRRSNPCEALQPPIEPRAGIGPESEILDEDVSGLAGQR